MATALVRYAPASATLTASSDNSVPFPSGVTSVFIRNNTPNTIYYALDATASTGSTAILKGRSATATGPCEVLHLYVTAVATVDDLSIGQIEVAGYAPLGAPAASPATATASSTSLALDPGQSSTFVVTMGHACTLNLSPTAVEGARYSLVLVGDASSAFIATFGTNFHTGTSTQSVAANTVTVINYVGHANGLYEVARTAALT